MFSNATGMPVSDVRDIISFAVPNMEWHHAGKLPKQYGGGMKKTYFVNSDEIINIATNWDKFVSDFKKFKKSEEDKLTQQHNIQNKRDEYLKNNAEFVTRVSEIPEFFIEKEREQHGKYGWFDCSNKSYNLPTFYSGYVFKNEQDYNTYLNL